MEEIVYLNGSLIPRSQARVSAFDHGFLYGYGLFETMRAYHGTIFLLDRHLKRLLDSAVVIGLRDKLTDIDLGKACVDTLRANGLPEARLRLTVSRGEVAPFPGTSPALPPRYWLRRQVIPQWQRKYMRLVLKVGYRPSVGTANPFCQNLNQPIIYLAVWLRWKRKQPVWTRHCC